MRLTARRFSCFVPGALPARNESERAARACWQAGSALKKKHTARVEACARKAKDIAWVPMERYAIRVEYRCRDRRRDPDNVIGGLKYILDGLQAAGVVVNDSWRNVMSIGQTWSVDRINPGAVVELEDWSV